MSRKDDNSNTRKTCQHEIDENLKRVYDDILDDDVPERFEHLLRQLRAQESSK